MSNTLSPLSAFATFVLGVTPLIAVVGILVQIAG